MEILIFDHMEEATEAEVQRMLPLVSTQRREQAMRYKHVFGQFCCLKSWMMLKEIMDNGQWTMDNGEGRMDNGQWTMDNGEWRLDNGQWTMDDGEGTMDNGQWTMDNWSYNEYGKPFFTPSPLHSFTPYFSISHCKEGIAVAIDDQPIGIDIEGIRHADEELIARTMNEGERLRIKDLGIREFTRLWTQKEAIVKAEGVGIMSFEQLQTILDNGQWTLDTFEKEKYIYSVAYQL